MYKFKSYSLKAGTYINIIFIEMINNKPLYSYSASPYRYSKDIKEILLKIYKKVYLTFDPMNNNLFDVHIFLMH